MLLLVIVLVTVGNVTRDAWRVIEHDYDHEHEHE
jgi:hypothetical protein